MCYSFKKHHCQIRLHLLMQFIAKYLDNVAKRNGFKQPNSKQHACKAPSTITLVTI